MRPLVSIFLLSTLSMAISPVFGETPDNGATNEPLGHFADIEWLHRDEPHPVMCPFRDQIDYDFSDIECGLIQVPENREREDTRSIELHYVRLRAQPEKNNDENQDNEADDEVRDDPIIYLTGGPGVEVGGYVERLKDHPVLERRDVYILEQRGIASSGEFCPFAGSRKRAERVGHSLEEHLAAMLEDSRDCAETAAAQGVDLTAYNTWENARDVRALRMALGYEDWNVWGISYGSHLGQALMHVDPEGTRAVILDAIVPNDLFGMGHIAEWYQRDLDKLFAACDEQQDCRRAFPELEERFRESVQSLAEEPETVEFEPSESYPEGKATTFANLWALPFGLLYEQDEHPAIPAIMAGLAELESERDPSLFRAIPQVDMTGGFSSSAGMSLAVRCNDGYTAEAARMAEDQAERFPIIADIWGTPETAQAQADLCEEVGMPPRDRIQYQPIVSSLPTLVINGAWDPITPPPMARHILPGLFEARYLEFPHAGHGPTRSVECAGDLMNDFFDDPEAEPDRECVEDGEEAAEYIAPHFETDAPRRAFLMMQEDEEGLRNHALWGGGSLLLAAFGGLAITGGFLRRRINRDPIQSHGGARLLSLLSVLVTLAWLGGMGLAGHASAEITPALFLVGMVGWAGWIAWLAPLATLLALGGMVQTVRHRQDLQTATQIGLFITAAGVLSVQLFGLIWGLWPL